MREEKISLGQGICLLMLYVYGSSIVFGLGAKAGKDAWISVLIALSAALVMVTVYAKILTLFPDKNIFEIFELVLGNFLGKLLSSFYIFFLFYLGSLVLRDFAQFLITVNFLETPLIFPIFLMVFACIWGVKAGVEVLGRTSQLITLVIIFITLLAIFMPTEEMKLEKIMPMLSNGWQPVLQGAFGAFAFPFGETVALISIFDTLNDSKKIFKVYWYGLLIAGLLMVSVVIAQLTFLGEMEYMVTYFPSYKTLSMISYGIIERFEVVTASLFFSAIFCKVGLCMLGVCRGITQVFKLHNYRVLVTPVAFLMGILGLIVYESIMELFEDLEFWKYLALPFEVIIPIIFLVIALFRSKQLQQLEREKTNAL